LGGLEKKKKKANKKSSSIECKSENKTSKENKWRNMHSTCEREKKLYIYIYIYTFF